jgi:hypothetical protein
LAIIKNTTGAVEKWYWIDSVRGITKYHSSNATTAFTTDANVLTVSGTTFTLGSTLSAKNYLVEFHKAGLASATASNEEGTINTTATSANIISGFSIIVWTGTGSAASIGHGLSKAPEFWMHKHNASAGGVYGHIGLTNPATYYLYYNTNAQSGADANQWNSTAPTDSLIHMGSSGNTNGTGTNGMVSYAWHSVEGYSSFGSYVGNSNADGPFINIGEYVGSMFVKRSTGGIGSYESFGKVLQPTNPTGGFLHFESTEIAGSADRKDIVSTGFKIRGGALGDLNISGSTYVYGSWGGTPIQGNGTDTSQGRAK